MKRHAEIAGGGIGGLSSALMLAKQGWTVRVHERSPEIRELGAGIYIKNNAIEVLEEFGVFEHLVPQGIRLERAQHVDRQGRLMQDRALVGSSRVHVFSRQALIETLRDVALRAGVEIITGSTAVSADPAGELMLENGQRLKADLVIAADGVRSKVRDSLGMDAGYRDLPTIINRYLIPSREVTPDAVTREHWSGRRRIGITPAGQNLTYIYQVLPERDESAKRLPNDVALWSRAFPRLRREFEIMAESEASQYNYGVVHCPHWQKGRVAVLGDAAHGLPPTLGQGAGLTLMNARALTAALSGNHSVEQALVMWEDTVRFISDRTQRWAMRYDFFTRQWPTALWFARPPIIWAFRTIPALNRRMRIADQGMRLTPLGLPITGASANPFQ
jgi:2-polyprenyl-6-methoxyphenol hydroxylase-like FAD-dependent oxidoreductase